MSGRLCLVEDDPTIRQLVSEKLKSRGYDVELYDEAGPLLKKHDVDGLGDLYILDVLLKGDASGLEVCRHLRQLSPTLPILILSALTEPSDRIEGLRSGADDYLPKPFEMEELLLRVDGMLKRRSWYGRLPENQSIYVWEENSINFLELEGRRGYESFALTQKECMLMKLLIEREGAVVSRDEILDKVWGYNVFPSHRTVDNFILRLRKCFENEPRRPKYIHSVRGLGYKFTSRPKDSHKSGSLIGNLS